MLLLDQSGFLYLKPESVLPSAIGYTAQGGRDPTLPVPPYYYGFMAC